MQNRIIPFTLIASLCAASLLCQDTAAPSQAPVQVKRVPPPASQRKSGNSSLPLVQNYDVGVQLQALGDTDTLTPAANASAPAASAESSGKPPNDYRPRTDVPLNPTALEAVRVSETWRGEQNTPAAGSDGRVLYAFGAGLPVVVCAPLRVCIIELQAGEKITGEPQIGDSVRWNISPGMYGNGEQATSMIVLKPQESGLDTNLLITTDRRAYYLRLVSKPYEYVARVAFKYPDEDNSQKWQRHLVEQQVQQKEARHDSQVTPAMMTAEKLNFSYKVTGRNEQLRPVRVYDDGAKTYIQMRRDIQNREAPALVVLGADGKGEMTNYRVREQTYIVDRLFDHAQLVLGSGKKAQKVEISREPNAKG